MTRRPPRPSRETAATPGHRVARGRPVYAMAPRGPVVTGHLTDRDGRRVLECRRDPAVHMLRLPRPAWALDAGALRDAEAAGCEWVRIITDAGPWEAPLRLWRDRGIPLDRGHGAQVALPVDAWPVTPAGPRWEPEQEARPVPRPLALLAPDDLREPVTAGRWWT